MAIEQTRAVYVPVENQLLDALWDTRQAPPKGLEALREQLGDAARWGLPHITLLDAMTTLSADAFDEAVRAVCAVAAPVSIRPEGLVVHRGRMLAIRCSCASLAAVEHALQSATSPLVHRIPIAHEEWSRARLHIIGDSDRGSQADLDVLERARARYVAAGSPPLPSSAWFRLNFLVELSRAADDSADGGQQLDRFLRTGEPPWYRGYRVYHLTLAAGLDAQRHDLDSLDETVWPIIGEAFKSFCASELVIVSDQHGELVESRLSDSLTRRSIVEQARQFTVVERVPLAPVD